MMMMTAILVPDTPLLDVVEVVAVVVVTGDVVAVVAGVVVATVVAGVVGAAVVTGAVVATLVAAPVVGRVVAALWAAAGPADRPTMTMARDNAVAVFLIFA